jgi:hypothetical protein
MDIHQRYLAEAAERHCPDRLSDELFRLIGANKPEALLEFLIAIPLHGRYTLLNRTNARYRGQLPINHAITQGAAFWIIGLLVRAGAQPDWSPRLRLAAEQPLLVAVRAGSMNNVKILLASGADVNVLDGNGYTALHWACFCDNPLMVRLLLNAPSLSYHNLDRNPKRLSPLGIAIHQKNLAVVEALVRSPQVDLLFIDTGSRRRLYDLAAEKGLSRVCLAMELAYRNHHSELDNRQLKQKFIDVHEYQVKGFVQHQLRNPLLFWVNDPRGPYTVYGGDPERRFSRPPTVNGEQWTVYLEEGSMDSEGWTQSFLESEPGGEALMVSLDGKRVVKGRGVFNCIDNYRVRLHVSVLKKKGVE